MLILGNSKNIMIKMKPSQKILVKIKCHMNGRDRFNWETCT